ASAGFLFPLAELPRLVASLGNSGFTARFVLVSEFAAAAVPTASVLVPRFPLLPGGRAGHVPGDAACPGELVGPVLRLLDPAGLFVPPRLVPLGGLFGVPLAPPAVLVGGTVLRFLAGLGPAVRQRQPHRPMPGRFSFLVLRPAGGLADQPATGLVPHPRLSQPGRFLAGLVGGLCFVLIELPADHVRERGTQQ